MQTRLLEASADHGHVSVEMWVRLVRASLARSNLARRARPARGMKLQVGAHRRVVAAKATRARTLMVRAAQQPFHKSLCGQLL